MSPSRSSGYSGWRGLAEVKPAKTNKQIEAPKVITRLLKSLQSVDFLSGEKDGVVSVGDETQWSKVSTDPVLSLAAGSIKSKDVCFGKGIWDDKLIVQAWVWPMQ